MLTSGYQLPHFDSILGILSWKKRRCSFQFEVSSTILAPLRLTWWSKMMLTSLFCQFFFFTAVQVDLIWYFFWKYWNLPYTMLCLLCCKIFSHSDFLLQTRNLIMDIFTLHSSLEAWIFSKINFFLRIIFNVLSHLLPVLKKKKSWFMGVFVFLRVWL